MYKMNMEPDIPAAMNHISHLSTDELKDLLNDDEKFEEILKEIQQFKDLESDKETLMASNRSLAEFNLVRQPELEEGKRQIQELSKRGSELCASVKEKLEQLRGRSNSMSVDTALDLLQAAAAEIEEESEKLAEKFLAGEVEVDEFLDQFLTRRKIMHTRKVKIEKMRELMRRTSATGNPGYPSFPGMSPSLPYPSGIVSMPMPF